MTDLPSQSTRQRGGAAVIIVAHAAAVCSLWLFIGLLHPGEIGAWLDRGGPFMIAVLAVSALQLTAATVFGVVHLRRPLPWALHLGGPMLPLLLGLVGTAVGLSGTGEAAASANLGDLARQWATGLAEGYGPLQLGVMAAAFGCAPLVVTGAMHGFVRRDVGANGPFAGLVVGGAGVMTGIAVFGLLLATSYGRLDLLLIVWLCAGLIFAGLVMAFGAAGLSAAGGVEDPVTRAQAFEAALLCAVAAVANLALQAWAVQLDAASDALRTLVTAHDNTRVGLVAGAGLTTQIALRAIPLVAVAALLVGLVQLSNTLAGASAWLRHRWPWAVVAIVCAAMLVGGSVALTSHRDALHAEVMKRLRHGSEAPIRLAQSSSVTTLPSSDGVVMMTREAFSLWGRRFDEPDSDDANGWLREKVLAAVSGRDASTHGDTRCGDRLGEATIVADVGLPARWVVEQMRRLAAAGVCSVQIAVAQRPADDPEAEERNEKVEAALRELPLVGELLDVAEQKTRSLRLIVGTPPPPGTEPDERPPALSVASGTVIVASTTLHTIRPDEDGRIDRHALGMQLATLLKERQATGEGEPDRAVFLAISGEAPLQALVDLADGAREVQHEDGSIERLFDRPVILLR